MIVHMFWVKYPQLRKSTSEQNITTCMLPVGVKSCRPEKNNQLVITLNNITYTEINNPILLSFEYGGCSWFSQAYPVTHSLMTKRWLEWTVSSESCGASFWLVASIIWIQHCEKKIRSLLISTYFSYSCDWKCTHLDGFLKPPLLTFLS